MRGYGGRLAGVKRDSDELWQINLEQNSSKAGLWNNSSAGGHVFKFHCLQLAKSLY